jgi:hypothetical protein
MNSKSLVLLGVVLFLSAGCSSKTTETSDARDTLRTALHAIQEDRLEEFKSTLSPELEKKIGDEPSLLRLRSALAGYQQVSLGDELLVNEVIDPNSPEVRRPLRQEFSEQVLGLESSAYYKLAYMATVSCEPHRHETSTNVERRMEGQPQHQEEVHNCEITQLE